MSGKWHEVSADFYMTLINRHGLPPYFFPHVFRLHPAFIDLCWRSGYSYLLPDAIPPAASSTRVDYRAFARLKCVEVDDSRIVQYFGQMIRSDFGFVERMMEEAYRQGTNPFALTPAVMQSLLEEVTGPLERFYYFEDPVKPERIPFLYGAIHQLSYDSGGLVAFALGQCLQVMQLFRSDGERLTPFCHDLDIGLDGVIVSRSSRSDEGDFVISEYDESTGQLRYDWFHAIER